MRRYLPAEPWEEAFAPYSAAHRLVADYAGLSIPAADALPWPAFLALRRDEWLHALRQTEAGRTALEAFWRLSRQECGWKGEMVIGGI